MKSSVARVTVLVRETWDVFSEDALDQEGWEEALLCSGEYEDYGRFVQEVVAVESVEMNETEP